MNVSIIDNHPVCLRGLELVCERIPSIVVKSVHLNIKSFIHSGCFEDLDILIIDMYLQGGEGTHSEVIKEIKKLIPHAIILSLSDCPSGRDRLNALRAGSNGYINKSESLESLQRAIEDVSKTRVSDRAWFILDDFIVISTKDIPSHDIAMITPAEKKVLAGLLKGYSLTSIANAHGRSVKTVSSQKRSLMKKMGMRTDIDLFRMFRLSYLLGLAPAD